MVTDIRNKIRKIVLEYGTIRDKKYHVIGKPFRVLIGAILSQRTRDAKTDEAAKNLFSVISNPEDIINMGIEKLQNLIKPSGFYRQKSKNIKKLCEILVRDYDGNVPKKREELLRLPGVGFKTADIVSLYAYGIPTIPVDIHVEIVSKRLGLVRKDAKYEETRATLENIFNKKEIPRINSGMVEFGQRVCLTARPKCYMCPLMGVCKYDKKNLNPPRSASVRPV
ncbi:MAG: endonuclease III [Candidatus Aenigmarchaeota archaeon]|nr:endonuclease III [Candidatus Aenigmarchaeota archaeon]